MKPDFSSLKACYVNCTLKQSPEKSHTQALMDVSAQIMKAEGVAVNNIRFVDHKVAFGVQPDMRKHGWQQDEWPGLFEHIHSADILVVGSPIWLGKQASVAQLFIERMYAMSGKLNDKGQSLFYGKAGGCIITGNEDGAKHVAMGLLYSLQHVGYSIPPQADCGWLGIIGPGPSYLDEGSNAADHEFTNKNTTFMTYNLLHLAKMMKDAGGYPSYGNSRTAWSNGEQWKFEKPTGTID